MGDNTKCKQMHELLEERAEIISDMEIIKSNSKKNASKLNLISDLVEELRNDFTKAENARLQERIVWKQERIVWEQERIVWKQEHELWGKRFPEMEKSIQQLQRK